MSRGCWHDLSHQRAVEKGRHILRVRVVWRMRGKHWRHLLFFPCHASRGQTSCTHHRCLCEPGFCAVGGKCVPQSAPTPAPAPSGRSVGFINPILYSNPGAFNDITQGDNNCTSSGKMCCAGYSAGPGWDAVTSMGSPKFEALKAALMR